MATFIESKVWTVKELAGHLKVHVSTVYRLLASRTRAGRRRLPAFRVGSEWRFNRESIERWLAEAEEGALADGETSAAEAS